MEEQKLIERPLMTENEFKNYIEENKLDLRGDFYEKNILHLRTFEAVKAFKSVRRAIRRGHVSLDGIIYPKRPFNNTKAGKNSINNKKKKIYERIKHMQPA